MSKPDRNLSKKEFSQKIDHVVKKHNFHVITLTKPTWCMLCTKFIYGLVHQGQECRACKYQCHKKCATNVPDTCGDPLPKVKGEKEKEPTTPDNFSSLARLVASAALQGVSPEQQQQDMYISSIKNGDKKMAQYLIERFIATNSDDINAADSLGNTALHYMAMGDSESDLILQAMKSPNLRCNLPNQDGNTPLHYLCQKFPTVDCIEVGEHMIARGADVNSQNKNGETPLHKAVFNGRVRFLLAEMLIHHNANLNIVSAQGETPLHYAVRLNREDLVEYLLIEGALSDIAGTKEKKTPLELAQEARSAVLESLLSRAEDVTNFLRGLDLQQYRKQFIEIEFTQGSVTSIINGPLLDSMGVHDPVHRTTLLQHKSTRRPRVSTESGKTLQASILSKTQDQHLKLRGDNWIIQNDEVEFIKKLGSGASGTVFKGLFLGVEVAIKVVKKELAADIEDFIKEFTTMYQIRDPHVISLYGAILEPKLCLVMELAHMGSLYNVLQNPTFNATWDNILDFAVEAAEGMEVLHALQPPLLHRDLKTLNLMVSSQMKIKVGDFGLSIFGNSNKSEKEMTGTAAYLAPELLEGAPFTTKADVYAFAVVFWELVNIVFKQEYQPPYQEYNLMIDMQILFAVSTRDIRPSLPPQCPIEIVEFFRTCWSKNPDDRPDFKKIVSTLRDLQTIYLERKRIWDTAIGAEWRSAKSEPSQRNLLGKIDEEGGGGSPSALSFMARSESRGNISIGSSGGGKSGSVIGISASSGSSGSSGSESSIMSGSSNGSGSSGISGSSGSSGSNGSGSGSGSSGNSSSNLNGHGHGNGNGNLNGGGELSESNITRERGNSISLHRKRPSDHNIITAEINFTKEKV